MKLLTLSIPLLLALCPNVKAEELPLIGALPSLPGEWSVVDQGSNNRGKSRHSWIVFVHEHSGDRFAIQARHLGKPFPEVTLNGPFTEAAITFFPGGYPAWNRPEKPELAGGSWGNAKLVSLAHDTNAIESTTYWEEESGAVQIAHGYCFNLGEMSIYLQHTSNQVITPEEANAFADQLIREWSTRSAPAP